ncbi:MAG: N-acetyl sugar amidotransferase [Candidatus Omnitrophica bacterium]|nr:N-acetyl sugar amidotransferase [Candidatus Omnitrophota bacterium]
MKYCKKCIMPDTRPETVFDKAGVCDACRSSERKHKEIDWEEREAQLREILDRYRSDGLWYDCIIPVSGGKNSCFQAYTMKYRFGMNPLCVNAVPCEMTDIGNKNLIFLRELGFDLIQVGVNRKAFREMVRIGFFKLGDSCWPEHIGIFTIPVKMAVQFKVPLLIWGENSQFEYGGPAAARDKNTLDKNWLLEYQMYGYRISDLVHEGFDLNDLKMFQYPSDEELTRVGVTGLFLGHYIKWDNKEQAERMKSLGFNVNPDGPVECAYFDYENLDCKWIGGLHDYMKYLKYGYSRATDQLSMEVRAGRMTREQAVDLVAKYEGKIPWKYIPDFLRYLDITEKEFFGNLDRFTNKKLFLCDENGNLVKDKDGNVIKKYQDYSVEAKVC